MRLRWRFVLLPGSVDPATRVPSTLDVVVDCPPGTALADVVALLPARPPAAPVRLDGPTAARVSVGGARLAGGTPVGHPPLLDGAVLRVAPPGEEVATGCSGEPPALSTGAAPPPVLELVVLAGPDSGRSHPLRPGRQVCGRAPACDVRIQDPRLSRHHCELVLGADGVSVIDLGSTNGTLVTTGAEGTGAAEGVPARAAGDAGPPRLLALGQRMRLGASLVTLQQAVPTRPPGLPVTGLGTRLVLRSPRVRATERVPVEQLPAAARQQRAAAFPVLAVALPALAAGGLAAWTGSTTYLVLAGLGPLLVAGGWWTARREARRDGRLGRREHARLTAQLTERAGTAAAALARARQAAMPGAESVLRECLHPTGRLWERDPDDDDAWRVRVGRAVDGSLGEPSGTERTTTGAAGGGAGALLPRVVLVSATGEQSSVPSTDDLVSVDLREGAVGVVEPGPDPSCARFLVGQLAAVLPPTVMDVVAVLGVVAQPRWDWLRLLPHAADETAGLQAPTPAAAARAAAELVARRRRGPGDGSTGAPAPGVLVVLDDPDGQVDPAELAWLPDAHRVGVHVVVVAPTKAGLPRGCAALVEPASADAVDVLVTRLTDGSRALATADRVGPWWGERVGRALAPLRPSATGTAGTLPDEVHLDELLTPAAQDVLHRWGRRNQGLAVPLGVGGGGVVTVDLTVAGPHALVAGTTGSGKSELLRTWLLGTAASRPPSEVAFLLVDYKGGATFDDLADLPHTVGVLTDLDGGATTRVLHSLRAEVRRRERLLAAAGARDLDAYRGSPDAGELLPRLLVVVDEFRILAEDAPEVLVEFVRLAATGRSLGMHLVLATQRPGGVVSADIRANAGLRIALRVQDAAESRDVVDRPDAARLPTGRPGRAVIVGSGLDQVVQTAYTGPGSASTVRLTVVPDDAGHQDTGDGGCSTSRIPTADGPRRTDPTRTDPTRTDPTRTRPAGDGPPRVLVGILEAARLAGVGRATCPWLPELPAVLSPPGDLGQHERAGTLLLGETDLPWEQARGRLEWSPVEDGPLLVLGGPRSGRTTTLEGVARAATAQAVPVVRLSGEPGQAGEPGDPDHVVDVLEALLAAGSAGGSGPDTGRSGTPERTDADGRPAATRLQVLLVLDDADPLLDPATDPAAADLLSRLLRNGHRGGVAVAVAGGRGLAGSRLAAAAGLRLVHRTTDSTDAVVAGAPRAARELPAVPGRCAVVGLRGNQPPPGAWLQAQVFAPPARTAPPVPTAPPLQMAPPLQIAPPLQMAPQGPPVPPAQRAPTPARVPRPLPRRLDRADLPAPDRGRLPAGLVAPDSAPWSLQPTGRRLFAVAGPPRSGRSSTLLLLAQQGLAAGLGLARGLQGSDEPGTGSPADLVLVDDADRLDEVGLAALEAWLLSGGGPLAPRLRPDATVVVSGATDWFADGFRGLPALVRRDGYGLVLSPGRTCVRDVLGARTRLQQRATTPGRGLVVDRGRVVRIQIARPDTRVPPDEAAGLQGTQQPSPSTTV